LSFDISHYRRFPAFAMSAFQWVLATLQPSVMSCKYVSQANKPIHALLLTHYGPLLKVLNYL
jgi:hypothetical protein